MHSAGVSRLISCSLVALQHVKPQWSDCSMQTHRHVCASKLVISCS